MPELEYPKFLETKEDYLFAIEKFPRDFWYDDVMDLYADGLGQSIVGEFHGNPNLTDNPDDSIIFFDEAKCKKLTSSYSGKAFTLALATKTYEYRKYSKKPVCMVVMYNVKPESKMAKLGFTNTELENVLFGSPNAEAIVDKIKEENEELIKAITKEDNENESGSN